MIPFSSGQNSDQYQPRVDREKRKPEALYLPEKRIATNININVFYDNNGNISEPKAISVNVPPRTIVFGLVA